MSFNVIRNTPGLSKYLVTSKLDCDVVPLTEVKDWISVFTDADDQLIQTLIDAAVTLAEKFMNRDILTTTYENYRDTFHQDLTLKRGAFQSVTSIEYLLNSVYTVLVTNLYNVSIGGVYGEVCEITSVPDTDDNCNAVKITFTSGFGDDLTFVPNAIKTAIKMYVATMYENRGDCDSCAVGSSGFPLTAENLLRGFRIISL